MIAVVLSSPAGAQVQWSTPDVMPARRYHAGAYDGARDRLVVLGGSDYGATLDDVWEWDGRVWTHAPGGPAPGDYRMVAVPVSGGMHCVAVGSSTSVANVETWTWNGLAWSMVATSGPTARAGHAVAFDAGRRRIVLFGGNARGPNAETWEWNGVSWSQSTPATSPPAREFAAMAYDLLRGVTVLFGGRGANGLFADTWMWDGTNWTQAAPTSGPSMRTGHAMAFDAAGGRIVLFGGDASTAGLLDDTWTWDGAAWNRVTTASAPSARAGAVLCEDAVHARVLLHGGQFVYGATTPVETSDVWSFDGRVWRELAGPTQPWDRRYPSIAFDATGAESVLFGGSTTRQPSTFLGDTWVWNGATWALRTPSTSPPPRLAHCAAFDSARGRVVMYGGYNSNGRLYETWEWDGATWALRASGSGPQATNFAALAYDERRAMTVLFGGRPLGSYSNETWEWNGATWIRAQPTASPSGRWKHGLAYDSARDRVVLYGGESSAGRLSDTWEYDGITWAQANAPSPSAADFPGLCYDSARQRVVLTVTNASIPETWEWDGAAWTLRTRSGPGNIASFVFDSARQVGVSFSYHTVMEYGPVHPAAFASVGSGCNGITGAPVLRATTLPFLADRYGLEVANLSVGALTAAIAHGFSDRSWNGVPLPLDLGPYGMPSCTVYNSFETLQSTSRSGSVASAALQVPNSSSLLGVVLFSQAVVLEPAANPAGVILSNGGRATIGAR